MIITKIAERTLSSIGIAPKINDEGTSERKIPPVSSNLTAGMQAVNAARNVIIVNISVLHFCLTNNVKTALQINMFIAKIIYSIKS